MLVMLAASPAHGFYHADAQSGAPIFRNERCYRAWDKNERAFALYDSLNNPLDKDSQGSVICPRSDEFVPADVFVQHPASNRHTPTKDGGQFVGCPCVCKLEKKRGTGTYCLTHIVI